MFSTDGRVCAVFTLLSCFSPELFCSRSVFLGFGQPVNVCYGRSRLLALP
jgi:hypothetical protein